MISRRSLLAIAASSLVRGDATKGTVVPNAPTRYEDLATELPVFRLTDPAHTSVLPAVSSHPISRKNDALLYASDQSGRFEAYRLDFKKGESRQLTEAKDLDPKSLVLSPAGNFCYFDGGRVFIDAFGSGTRKQLAALSNGFDALVQFSSSFDSPYAVITERKGMQHRVRLLHPQMEGSKVLAEADEPILDPLTRPKRASVLYRRGGALYLANFDGKQNYRLRTLEGSVAQAQWSPDGRSLLYLHVPNEAGKLRSIREFTPDTNEDKAVADTTQFAAFARNADASVFVGASGSKASPYVLLLARKVKRELTLCEHRASDPSMVNPQFSPNSQQVFFASDLHGKPAIYRMDVAKLVADTAETEALYK